MNKKIKTIIYYIIIALLFILTDQYIYLLKIQDENKVIKEINALENVSLKKEVEELSQIKYSNFEYVLGKITIKNLYGSNTYFITPNSIVKDNTPVINNLGLIGLYNNFYLEPTSSLDLSIKINNNYGTLNKGTVSIKHDNYQINDPIYTSGLTNIPEGILVGYIKNIENNNDIEDKIKITYIANNSTYVGILTNYA